jgi:flagellar biogenesis protein FliO
VLGVTASQVNTLHVLEKPLPGAQAGDAGDFRHKLNVALKRQVTT